MTFEEFKELALNPPYADYKSVYRIDVHRYGFTYGEYNFRKMMFTQTLMCLDWQSVQCMLKQFRSKRHLKILLYALYVYRLPVDMDISDNSYQQLWVYDRYGNLNGKSMRIRLKKDKYDTTSRFRGHEAKSIRFRPGDIVDVYDRMENCLKPAVVVRQPPTIDQCWNMWLEVEKACISEDFGMEYANLIYDPDDCYCVVFGPDFEKDHSFPYSYDVFPSTSGTKVNRQELGEWCRLAIENHSDEINSRVITQQTATDRIKELRSLADRL